MSKKTSFTIKDKNLAVALEISLERLYEIIEIFDADPHDEWDLKEGDHFIWLSENRRTRLFSEFGAFAIAKYMDSIEKKTLWGQIKEFITRHKEKIRNAFVRQRVQDNCSSLTIINNRHFLSKKDVVSILCTSHARLNKAFEDAQRTRESVILYEDFDDIEGVRHYSLSGLVKLSKNLSEELKSKDRQAWCAAVTVTGSKTLKQIISAEEKRKQEVQAVMLQAKKRDKNKCQITDEKPGPANRVNLAAHHIFSQKHYPHLATSLDNLITLTDDVHKEFHHWNGGFDKPCTIDDLIRFVRELYPEQEEASLKLYQIKKKLCYVESQNLAA
jgi:hypothetical protein